MDRNTFRLLSVDMDGTLLNGRKELPEAEETAIRRLAEMGKTVVLTTGRCAAEIKEFLPRLASVRYFIGESGAYIRDLEDDCVLLERTLPVEVVRQILQYAQENDIMPQVNIGGNAVMAESDMARIGHFQMTHYEGHFRRTGKFVPSLMGYCGERGFLSGKISLYHTSLAAREETLSYFADKPVTATFSEATSLELTPEDTDKGTAFAFLVERLQIPFEETIAIGDSMNDVPAFALAGLSVAMGNASDEVKKRADTETADNDHDGVRQAIDKYF